MIDPSPQAHPAHPVPPRPGPGGAAHRMAQMLRVDHAGELGAVHIYRGQRLVFGATPKGAAMEDSLSEMEAAEAAHLDRFNTLLNERHVRPTLLAPVWRAAGLTLGVATALMGDKAAHACTEAVESVIENHYAEQIAEVADQDPELAAELTQFREEELAHRDHAVEHGAREAPGYELLSAIIKIGCKAAIRISEKL